jgi:hypothetical protein
MPSSRGTSCAKRAARSRRGAASSYGIRPATRFLIGEPFLEIIRDAIERRRDLVIM